MAFPAEKSRVITPRGGRHHQFRTCTPVIRISIVFIEHDAHFCQTILTLLPVLYTFRLKHACFAGGFED